MMSSCKASMIWNTRDRWIVQTPPGPSRKEIEERGYEIFRLTQAQAQGPPPLYVRVAGKPDRELEIIGEDADGWYGACQKSSIVVTGWVGENRLTKMKEPQDKIKMTGYVGPSRKQLEEQGYEVVSLEVVSGGDPHAPTFAPVPGHDDQPVITGADGFGWFAAFKIEFP